jgi:hypothetical protein
MSEGFELTSEQVSYWLDKVIERDSRILDIRPVMTDTGIDITQTIEGRLNAYIEVRAYIKRGKKGLPYVS